MTVLGQRTLNRALLARQSLLRRSSRPALAMVDHLYGMQAQAPFPPYYGLWTRLDGFRPEDLGQLIVDREVVRIALMRGTIHLVTAADALALRPLTQPLLEQWNAKQLTGVDLAAIGKAGRQVVEERPQTNGDLSAALADQWPDIEPRLLTNCVRALVPLVQVPPRGVWGKAGQATHTTIESWLGRPLEALPSLHDMVLRYLAAYGPASVLDAQAWSGLTRLGEVFDDLRPRLVTFRTEQGRELFDRPDAPRPDPDTPAPVRFLPEFDNTLLSYADRTRIIAEPDRLRVFTVNGIIRSTILVDGVVHGMWRVTRKRRASTLTIQPFRRLSKKDSAALAREGVALLTFAAPDDTHDIQFNEPD